MKNYTIALFCLIVVVGPFSWVQAAPNIVVIMVDDLDERSLNDLLAAGHMKTFDRVFRQNGMRFRQSFVTNPVCCPSRASYLTGQYSHNNGVLTNMALFEKPGVTQAQWFRIEDQVFNTSLLPSNTVALGAVGLLDDNNTLATRLQNTGYVTAHIGKYLNGYGAAAEHADLSPAYDPTYVPPGWSQWHGLVDNTTYCMYNFQINHNHNVKTHSLPAGVEEDDNLYQTKVLTDIAATFIRNTPGNQGFFLSITPLAPHAETSCLKSYWNGRDDDWFSQRVRPAPKYKNAAVPTFQLSEAARNDDMSDNPAWMQALSPLQPIDHINLGRQYQDRLRAMLSVDDMIARVVDELTAKGIYQNTILIFTSDNGWFYGEHRLSNKVSAYSEASRVPLYIHYPFAATAAYSDAMVINNDLAPTILDLAGVSYGNDDFDGRSFAGLLETGKYSPWKDRKGFYIQHSKASPDSGSLDYPSYGAIRTWDRLYIETNAKTIYFSPPPQITGTELYDREVQTLNRLQAGEVPATWNEWARRLAGCKGLQCRLLEDASAP